MMTVNEVPFVLPQTPLCTVALLQAARKQGQKAGLSYVNILVTCKTK